MICVPYRGVLAALLLATAPLVFGGCGGASGATGARAAEAEWSAGSSNRGRAAEGARCDFGGSADATCSAPLSCCYGPPEAPGDFGRCQPSCS